jgi:hypothetical protein
MQIILKLSGQLMSLVDELVIAGLAKPKISEPADWPEPDKSLS